MAGKVQGFDLKSRSDFMGHISIQTTEIYDNPDLSKMKEMVG